MIILMSRPVEFVVMLILTSTWSTGLYSAGISDAQKRDIVEGVRVPEQ